jgi:hypothetical protein
MTEEVEALFDLWLDIPDDGGFSWVEAELPKKLLKLIHGHGIDFRNGLTTKTNGAGHGIDSGPPASGAGKEIALRKFFPSPFQFLLFFCFVLGVDLGRFDEDRPVTLTFRAPTMGTVEGKEARVEFIKGAPGAGAKKVVAIDGGLPVWIEGVKGAFA